MKKQIKLESIRLPQKTPVCGKCGVKNVRIYRYYAGFRRVDEDRCNKCIDTTAWLVPVVLDEHGECWGYSSVAERNKWGFYALPDNDESGVSPMWKLQYYDKNLKNKHQAGWSYNLNKEGVKDLEKDFSGILNIIRKYPEELDEFLIPLPTKGLPDLTKEQKEALNEFYSETVIFDVNPNISNEQILKCNVYRLEV